MMEGLRLHINGIVQGVGFRPFVYGLAARYELTGWVSNTSAGVDLELNGEPQSLQHFRRALRAEAPPLARIETIEEEACAPNGYEQFEIRPSAAVQGAFQPVSPDVSICDDCLRELLDPNDRRYRYPFINCTNCGPRYTIIKDLPYDRPATTMAAFPLCEACAAEYADPLDRRFHAQPVACPQCGPHIWLERTDGDAAPRAIARQEGALQAARELLASGKILAIKGLGGFHLACDATNERAVSELRRRKLRRDKPFALMMPDLEAVARVCLLDDEEMALLTSRERPIVILSARSDSPVSVDCAPGQNTLGVMLPYTPLHVLLLERAPDFPEALVMTSGNLVEEPIVTDNEEARRRLAPLADALLLHDRPIHTRCDDSVVQVVPPLSSGEPILYPLRRARGYAPFPVYLPRALPPLLAVGAELKNTFCLTRERHAFLSQHVGDLQNHETLQSFERSVAHLEQLFRVQPQLLAHDAHPDMLSTRYALERAEREGLPTFGVQHHHAHAAALMAEHGLDGERPVIGVIFDGVGYGTDGAVWGGEFLVADYAGFQRSTHLAYAPLPGGDMAVREPWRYALAWLAQAGIAWESDLPPVQHGQIQNVQGIEALSVLQQQLARGINCPQTSSMGRLFDAVSALVGVRQQVNYEGQAAIELEALAGEQRGRADGYEFDIQGEEIDPAPMLKALVADLRQGLSRSLMAARFHAGVARMVLDVCRRLRDETGLYEVGLSGGVWQNLTLLQETRRLLLEADFTVYIHRRVPANDGGLALGQALIAAAAASEKSDVSQTSDFLAQESTREKSHVLSEDFGSDRDGETSDFFLSESE